MNRQGKGKIEWCDLWVFIMQFAMATVACCSHIKKATGCITKVMVVQGSRCPTVETRQFRCLSEAPIFNSTADCLYSHSCHVCTIRSTNMPSSNVIAASAFSTQFISAGSIIIKGFLRLPCFACGTPFQTRAYLGLVFLERQSKPPCCNLRNSYPRTHRIHSLGRLYGASITSQWGVVK